MLLLYEIDKCIMDMTRHKASHWESLHRLPKGTSLNQAFFNTWSFFKILQSFKSLESIFIFWKNSVVVVGVKILVGKKAWPKLYNAATLEWNQRIGMYLICLVKFKCLQPQWLGHGIMYVCCLRIICHYMLLGVHNKHFFLLECWILMASNLVFSTLGLLLIMLKGMKIKAAHKVFFYFEIISLLNAESRYCLNCWFCCVALL